MRILGSAFALAFLLSASLPAVAGAGCFGDHSAQSTQTAGDQSTSTIVVGTDGDSED